jgi:hypothetical protein
MEANMKKKLAPGLAVLALVLAILACSTVTVDLGGSGGTVRGSGTLVEEDRPVSSVTGVQLGMPGELTIEVGSAESLRISAEDNLLEYIETVMRGGTLVIETRDGVNIRSTKPVEFYLTVTGLESVANSSAGNIQVDALQSGRFTLANSSSGKISLDGLNCTSLRVTVSSSGDVILGSLVAEEIDVEISSSGNVEIGMGQVQKQEIEISSSGAYLAGDLASVEANVNLSSSGSARIRVSERLTGRLSSSGNIRYIGDPQVDVSTSSSGRVIQVDE